MDSSIVPFPYAPSFSLALSLTAFDSSFIQPPPVALLSMLACLPFLMEVLAIDMSLESCLQDHCSVSSEEVQAKNLKELRLE